MTTHEHLTTARIEADAQEEEYAFRGCFHEGYAKLDGLLVALTDAAIPA